MSIEKSYNFRRINRHITSSGVVSVELLQSLSNEEYKVVINLLPENHERAISDEKEIVESQNIEYVNIPVDFDHPKITEYRQFSQILSEIKNKKIHIHCAANFRVSAFYGAYAVSQGIWSVAEALDFIGKVWNLAEYPVWQDFLNEIGLGGSAR